MATATKQSLEMARPRDGDELEGTLLPPVAVPVDQSSHQVAAAAVPVEAFVYNEDMMADEAEADIPTAPFLPTYQNGQTREEMEKLAIAMAKRRGKIEAEREKEFIQKASREQYSKNWHAKRQVQVANDEARRRNQQGVHVTEDKYDVAREKQKEEQPDYAFPSSYKGGYEVSEYETTEYKASDDYEVSEYKSVYDPWFYFSCISLEWIIIIENSFITI